MILHSMVRNSTCHAARGLTVWLLTQLLLVALRVGGVELWAQEKHFLWKVESGQGRVYLFGSIHLLRREDAALGSTINETFDKSQRLVLEVDLLQHDRQRIQQLILQKGINLDGKTLQQKVSRETFQAATVRAHQLGIDIKALDRFKPWFAGLTMMVMHLQKLGFDPNAGVDRQLAERAKQANKPVSGLESAESQFHLLDGLSPSLQEMMLRHSLGEMAQIERTVAPLVRAWRNGDVSAAETLFLESMKAYPEIQEKILDARNRNWLPQIEQFINHGDDTFVVVGAAHLVGKNGVIELLKRRGYKLEQM